MPSVLVLCRSLTSSHASESERRKSDTRRVWTENKRPRARIQGKNMLPDETGDVKGIIKGQKLLSKKVPKVQRLMMNRERLMYKGKATRKDINRLYLRLIHSITHSLLSLFSSSEPYHQRDECKTRSHVGPSLITRIIHTLHLSLHCLLTFPSSLRARRDRMGSRMRRQGTSNNDRILPLTTSLYSHSSFFITGGSTHGSSLFILYTSFL